MKQTYRKTGRSVRWENGALLHVSESGIATEEGQLFVCEPVWSAASAVAAFQREPHIAQVAAKVAAAVAALHTIRIERLIVLYGEAVHTFGDKTWRDESCRIHLALANGHMRALIDLGDFALDPIVPVAEALARAEEMERAAPARLRLAPNVAAALLPSLAADALPSLTLTQRAGGIDGKGNRVEDATEPWPNWYRPSYRIRPARAPFNLAATCHATEIDPSVPRAIALLEPPHDATLRVLVADGFRVYPSRVPVTRVMAIGTEVTWYPYGAGVLGAEILLSC